MKKPILILSTILLLNIFSTKTYAQFIGTFSIQSVVGLPDTLIADSAYSFGFLVENSGNTIYSGTIDFDFFVSNNNPDSTHTFGVGQVGNFTPSDTVVMPVNNYAFSVTDNTFNIGDNVVVVWPRGLGNSTVLDSLTFHVYITDLSGINEDGKTNSDLKIFPNPARDFVSFSSEKNKIELLRIFDMSGRLVLQSKSPLKIFTGHLREGIYIAEVQMKDGLITRQKFLVSSSFH
jgi:hypothetical protein